MSVPRRFQHHAILILVLWTGGVAVNALGGRGGYDRQRRLLTPDFLARLAAAQMVVDGQRAALYQPDQQALYQARLLGRGVGDERLDAYLSPPFVAYAFAPLALTGMSYRAASLSWSVLSLFALVGSLALLWPVVPALRISRATFVALGLSAAPAMDLLGSGQDSAWALLLLVIVLRLLCARRDGLAGACLGLGLFKPQLFVLVPCVLAANRRWRALAAAIVTGSALAALSWVAVGNAGLVSLRRLLASDTYRIGIAAAWSWKMLSLPSFVRALIPGAPRLMAITAALILAAAGALWVGGGRRSGDDEQRLSSLFALAVLGTVVTSPHVFLYDGVVLLLPAAVLLNAAPADRRLRWMVVVAYLILWTTPLRAALWWSRDNVPAMPRSLLAAPWAAPVLCGWFLIACNDLRQCGVPRWLAATDRAPR